MHLSVEEALVKQSGPTFHQGHHIEDRDAKKNDDAKHLIISFPSNTYSGVGLLESHAAATNDGSYGKDVDDDTITTASSSSETDFTHKKHQHHHKEELCDVVRAEKSEPVFRSSCITVPQALASDDECSIGESEVLLTLKRANPVYDSDDEDDYYSAYARPSKRPRQYDEIEDERTSKDYDQSQCQEEPFLYYHPESMWRADKSKNTLSLFSSSELLFRSDEPALVFSPSGEKSS